MIMQTVPTRVPCSLEHDIEGGSSLEKQFVIIHLKTISANTQT